MSNSMSWRKLLTPKSVTKDLSAGEGRSPFVKDQDKIIFSWAFRRMSRKTQVHPMAINDHVHNRLTHSIEVACVGRSLGDLVASSLSKDPNIDFPKDKINDLGEIVRAACLAHDIGNPPFGHAGESAIQSWAEQQENNWKLSKDLLEDLKNFDGNAMGFRVLTHIEYYAGNGGMRLSFPTLASMMKYPWTAKNLKDSKKKFCCLAPDVEKLKEIADVLGLKEIDEGWYARHPLSYLVEAADDICYSLLDIEDAFQLSLISEKDFHGICLDDKGEKIGELYEYVELIETKRELDPTRRMALLRGRLVEYLIEDSANAFCNNYDDIMNGKLEGDLLSVCSDSTKFVILNAKSLCKKKVYNHHRKVEVEIGSYSCIKSILDLFYESTLDVLKVNKNVVQKDCEILQRVSFRTQRIIALTKMPCELYSEAKDETSASKIMYFFLDFLAGMTDNYATHLGKQFNGQGGL